MRAISQGEIFTIHSDDLKTYEQLPAQVYYVRFNKNRGFYLEVSTALEIKETRVYGVHEDKCRKVLNSFKSFDRNLGVILSGDKGIGKSLFAKMLAIMAVSEGYPLILVDTYIPGIASYLESIEQEVVVVFDEFDKTFGEVKAEDGMASPQTELLSLFDGMAMGKKLFVVTCNDLNKLNEFIVNRPGRFHYHFRFEYPTPAEITEYMHDKLPEDKWCSVQDVISFSRKVKLNYDCLRAIVFELSTGLSFRDAVSDLNIVNLNKEAYTFVLRFENGMTAVCKRTFMDAFDDDDMAAVLEDKNGASYLRVDFNPGDIVWNEHIGGNIVTPDKFNLEYDPYNYDDEETNAAVAKAKATTPAYLLVKRCMSRGIHYAV